MRVTFFQGWRKQMKNESKNSEFVSNLFFFLYRQKGKHMRVKDKYNI